MPRKAPPPWVRWVGEDTIDSCDQIREQLDQLQVAILEKGARLDEIMTSIIEIRREVTTLRDNSMQLQKAVTTEQLARWLINETNLVLKMTIKILMEE